MMRSLYLATLVCIFFSSVNLTADPVRDSVTISDSSLGKLEADKYKQTLNLVLTEVTNCIGSRNNPAVIKVSSTSSPDEKPKVICNIRTGEISVIIRKGKSITANRKLTHEIINAIIRTKLSIPDKNLYRIQWITAGIYNMIKLKKSTVPYLPNPYPGVRTLLYLGENLDIENILSFHPDLKSGKYLNDLYGSECSLVISYVKNTVGDPDFFSKYILSTVTGKDINSYNYLLSAMLKQNLFESLSAKDRYIISEIIRSKFNSFALESVFNSDNPIPVKMAVARFNSAMSFEYSLKNKPEESGKSDLSGLPAIWNKISRPEETMLGINARLDTLIAISPNLLKPPLYKIKKLLSEVSSYTDSNANEFHKQLKEARKEFIDAALKQEKIDNILNDKELNYFSLAQQYKDYFAIIKKQKNTIRLLCPGLDSYLDNEEKQ